MKKMKSNYFQFNTVMSVVLMHLFFFAAAAEGKTFTREQVIEKLQNLDNKNTVKALINRISENTTNNGDDVITSKVSVDIEAEFKQGSLMIYYPQIYWNALTRKSGQMKRILTPRCRLEQLLRISISVKYKI